MIAAALDVGSNTVRLLVARREAGGRLVPLRYALRITRLGGGATPAGLAEAAIERTVAAIADFARLMRADGATAWRAVATAAARDAANGGRLVERSREAAGIDLEVISADEEARTTLAGVRWGLSRLADGVPERFALVDIGGGSTEVVISRPAADGTPAVRAASMPIGTVRLVERHLRHDPPTGAELAAMARDVAAHVERHLAPALAGLLGEGAVPLVGTAGSITTMAAMDLELTAYDRGRVDGHRLTRVALEARLARLVAMPTAARLGLPGLEPGREDLIVPGIALLLAVMERLGAGALTVVDAGLLEGVCLAVDSPRDGG